MLQDACRRAEINITVLKEKEDLDKEILLYINRLSDYLFTLARFFSKTLKINELNGMFNENSFFLVFFKLTIIFVKILHVLDIRITYLSDAPWPATKDELIDFSIRLEHLEVVENLQSMEDEGDVYESLKKYGQIFLLMVTIYGTRTNTSL